MTTKQVADRLVELCRQGKFDEAQDELFADNAISLEPAGAPGEKAEGLDQIRAKGKQFEEMTEAVHGIEVTEPVVAENFFTVGMTLDATWKGMGRTRMEEICLYEVRDGKVVKERFFYTPQIPGA